MDNRTLSAVIKSCSLCFNTDMRRQGDRGNFTVVGDRDAVLVYDDDVVNEKILEDLYNKIGNISVLPSHACKDVDIPENRNACLYYTAIAINDIFQVVIAMGDIPGTEEIPDYGQRYYSKHNKWLKVPVVTESTLDFMAESILKFLEKHRVNPN